MNLLSLLFSSSSYFFHYSILRVLPLIVGVDSDEDPPVPMPNTEVKLIYVENTWLVTTWEDRKMPTYLSMIEKSLSFLYLCYTIYSRNGKFLYGYTYSSIAQSVEHAAVNPRVLTLIV